jgi:hypothetical protein
MCACHLTFPPPERQNLKARPGRRVRRPGLVTVQCGPGGLNWDHSRGAAPVSTAAMRKVCAL